MTSPHEHLKEPAAQEDKLLPGLRHAATICQAAYDEAPTGASFSSIFRAAMSKLKAEIAARAKGETP